jgi:hypothetical protein
VPAADYFRNNLDLARWLYPVAAPAAVRAAAS